MLNDDPSWIDNKQQSINNKWPIVGRKNGRLVVSKPTIDT